MSEVKITVRPNGSLLIQGDVKLLAADGRELAAGKQQFSLCRCGASGRKPFCDGTHKSIGFADDGLGPQEQGG